MKIILTNIAIVVLATALLGGCSSPPEGDGGTSGTAETTKTGD